MQWRRELRQHHEGRPWCAPAGEGRPTLPLLAQPQAAERLAGLPRGALPSGARLRAPSAAPACSAAPSALGIDPQRVTVTTGTPSSPSVVAPNNPTCAFLTKS